MSKIKKTFCIVCCLCLMVCVLAVPANAASILTGCYDPADYIHDITISDETKTIRYDFSEIRYAFRYWDNGTNTVQDFVDNFSVQVDALTQHVVACYPFGVIRATSNLDSRGGALYVGDILPGSPIAFDFGIEVYFEWVNDGQPFDMTVVYEPVYLLYDDAGQLIDTVNLDKETVVYTLGDGGDNPVTTTLSEIRHITGSIPADASYIVPFYRIRAKNSGNVQVWLTLSVQGAHTSLSVDINTVLENSNQMQAINDKLSDIITGGEAGDRLDDATGNLDNSSDQFDDTLGDYQDKADQLPTTPSNFDDIIDNDLLDSTIKDAQKIFDWDASGLNYMFVPMGISLSLAVLFYVVFGRE